MKAALSISHNEALRWGNAGLVATLSGSLALVGLISAKAPDQILLLPVALMAICSGVLLFTMPRLNFIVWLGGLALLFSSEPGFQIHEVLYGLYFYGYLAHWYGRRLLLYKKPIIQGSIDISVALWLVLGLGLGIALGWIFGADFLHMRGEAIALTLLAIYFPVKEFCIRDKYGPQIILYILTLIALWITVDNIMIARRTFADATMLWEISAVRTSGRELLLTFPGVILLAVLPTLEKNLYRALMALVLGTVLVGLLLTKSRTFWVEYLVAVAILIVISPGADRKRLIVWCTVCGSLLLLFGALCLPSYFSLMVTGISSRFATLGAATADMSLINRVVETRTVWSHVVNNPILGYGLGTVYSFFDIIASSTRSRSYSHVGMVAVLYKFGLWGGAIVGYVWLASLYTIYRDSRKKLASALDRAMLRGIFVCSLSMVLPAITTSVFFEDEKLAAFILITALGIGIHFRDDQCIRLDHSLTNSSRSDP